MILASTLRQLRKLTQRDVFTEEDTYSYQHPTAAPALLEGQISKIRNLQPIYL